MTRAISPRPLVGEILRRKVSRGISVTETAYAPGLVIEKHAHPFPYFCAVLHGAFDDMVGQRARLCDDSSIFFRPQGEVHADRFQRDGARCLVIELKPDLIDRTETTLSRLKESCHFSGGVLFSLSLRLRDELHGWDEFSALSAEGLVCELIAAAARDVSGFWAAGPHWLRTATEFIAHNFNESLTLRDIAKAARVHPAHLARKFREVHRCTIGEYVRRQRIQFCLARLSDPDLPLTDIAMDAGFADQSHFCRTFKRIMGETPAAHRRRLLNAQR